MVVVGVVWWSIVIWGWMGCVLEVFGYFDDLGVDILFIIRKYRIFEMYSLVVWSEVMRIGYTICVRDCDG